MLSIYNSMQTEAPAPVTPSSSYKFLLRDQVYTSDFFDFPATILIIEDYFETIPKEIYNSNAGTISNVEFFKVATFSNIQGVLVNFPNLQFLKFSNLSLDNYQQMNPKQLPIPEFSAVHLLQVTFSHFGGLTTDEMIVLDFFTQMVSCNSIASLHFNQKNSFRFEGPLPTLQHNEVLNKYSVELGPWTVYNFLKKYSRTIKSLKIERHEFLIFPSIMGAQEMLAKLSVSLQLKQLFFLVDTYGMDTLLPFQTEVEQLSCKWHSSCEVIPWNVSNVLLAVAKCCQSNNSKLVSIEVPGCIEVDTEKYPNFQAGPDWIDLQNFQECSSLTNLHVEEACQFKITTQQFLGTFINSQFLPTGLRSLRIVVGKVLEEEFQLLTYHFQHLIHLDSFLLRSGTQFFIDQTSFGNILKLPKTTVNSIVICNGTFTSDFQPHHILMSASQGRENDTFWKLIISDKWLSLRKDKLAYSFVA